MLILLKAIVEIVKIIVLGISKKVALILKVKFVTSVHLLLLYTLRFFYKVIRNRHLLLLVLTNMVYRFITLSAYFAVMAITLIQLQGCLQLTVLCSPPIIFVGTLKLDAISVAIRLTVVGISICVLYYCTYYMRSDSYN